MLRRLLTLVLVIVLATVATAPAASQWVVIPGNARDIGLGHNGGAWVIGSNGLGGGNFGIFHWAGTGEWVPRPGGAVRIAVGPDGNAWVVAADRTIWQWNGSQFVRHNGLGIDITAGPTGAHVVGTDGQLFTNVGGTWVRRLCPNLGESVRFQRLAAAPNGDIWLIVAEDVPVQSVQGRSAGPGSIFRFASNTAECYLVDGGARDIGVGGNATVWVLGRAQTVGGYEVFRFTGNASTAGMGGGDGWQRIDGGAVQITVNHDGNAWVVNDAGTVFRFQ